MIDIILILMLFAISTWLGSIIMGIRKVRCFCKLNNMLFTIYYGNRILYVIGDRKVRMPSYSRKRNIEEIRIPIGRERETAQQVEAFFINSRNTSILSKRLFNFSARGNPVSLIQYDPDCAKELVDIQNKLNIFVRTP